jgi:hypothetical protein
VASLLDGTVRVPAMINLTELNLSRAARLTASCVSALAVLTNLKHLDLSRVVQLTDQTVEQLSALQRVTRLSLSHCELITDAALAHIAKLWRLEFLDVRSCVKLTDAGLPALSKLHLLRSFGVSGCLWVTKDGVEALSASLRPSAGPRFMNAIATNTLHTSPPVACNSLKIDSVNFLLYAVDPPSVDVCFLAPAKQRNPNRKFIAVKRAPTQPNVSHRRPSR